MNFFQYLSISYRDSNVKDVTCCAEFEIIRIDAKSCGSYREHEWSAFFTTRVDNTETLVAAAAENE